MIRAVLALAANSVRRTRGLIVAMTTVTAGFQVLLAALADWLRSQSAFAQIEGLVPPAMRQLMGPSLTTMLSVSGIVALGYFHTAIEAALVALVIVIGSEPAGEIESGFVDVALSRPLARAVPIARTILLLVLVPAVVVAAMGFGTTVGARWVMPPTLPKPAPRLVWSLMLNLWALLVAWGGAAVAVASVSRRRDRATSIVGLAGVVLLLLDYLARAWKPLEQVAWLSPFHFYSPLTLVMGGRFPATDVVTLVGVGVAGWAIAFVCYSRRDL